MADGVVTLVLLGVGCVLAVFAALATLVPGSVHRRLHLLTVLTSAAGPLLGIAAAVHSGSALTIAFVLVIIVLLAGTGPVLSAALARFERGRSE